MNGGLLSYVCLTYLNSFYPAGMHGLGVMPGLPAVPPLPMPPMPGVGMSPPLVSSVPPSVPPMANGVPMTGFSHQGMAQSALLLDTPLNIESRVLVNDSEALWQHFRASHFVDLILNLTNKFLFFFVIPPLYIYIYFFFICLFLSVCLSATTLNKSSSFNRPGAKLQGQSFETSR